MTSQKQVTRKVEWTIENVTREKIGTAGFELYSKPFVLILGDNVTKWKIKFGVKEKDSKLYLRTFLFKMSVTRDDFYYNLKFNLDDCKTDTTKRSDTLKVGNGRGWNEFLELDKLFDRSLKYLDAQSTMKLVMELKIFFPDEYNPEQPLIKRRKTYSSDFENEQFADFTLKSSDGKLFKVHRLVLAKGSEYFEKLLTTNMQEKIKGQAILRSVTSSILEEVIKFIYTGNAEIADSKKAKEMIDAAEQFGLTDLKKICEEKFLIEVNEENALEMLKTADKYNAKQLEIKSLEIIILFTFLFHRITNRLLVTSKLLKTLQAGSY